MTFGKDWFETKMYPIASNPIALRLVDVMYPNESFPGSPLLVSVMYPCNQRVCVSYPNLPAVLPY